MSTSMESCAMCKSSRSINSCISSQLYAGRKKQIEADKLSKSSTYSSISDRHIVFVNKPFSNLTNQLPRQCTEQTSKDIINKDNKHETRYQHTFDLSKDIVDNDLELTQVHLLYHRPRQFFEFAPVKSGDTNLG